MDRPGKTIFKKLDNTDLPQIEKFCVECKNLGYENNSSLELMKFNNAVFFGAFLDDKLFSLAGLHKFPEINEYAYRCLFRGAQLPGYTPEWSMDIFNSGIHFSQFIYMQIKHVQEFDSNAEFYITTNIDNKNAGASSRLHKIMMPRLAKKGYWDLYNDNILLYNVQQSVWRINVDKYMSDRDKWIVTYKQG